MGICGVVEFLSTPEHEERQSSAVEVIYRNEVCTWLSMYCTTEQSEISGILGKKMLRLRAMSLSLPASPTRALRLHEQGLTPTDSRVGSLKEPTVRLSDFSDDLTGSRGYLRAQNGGDS